MENRDAAQENCGNAPNPLLVSPRPPRHASSPINGRAPAASSKKTTGRVVISFLLGVLTGLILGLTTLTTLWTWWQQPLQAHLDAFSAELRGCVQLYITGPPCPPVPLHQSVWSLALEAAQAVMPLVTCSSSSSSPSPFPPPPAPRPLLDRLAELHSNMHELCLFAPDAHGRHDLVSLCRDYTTASAHATSLLFDTMVAVPEYVREARDNVQSVSWAVQRIGEQLAQCGDGDDTTTLLLGPSCPLETTFLGNQAAVSVNKTLHALVGACLDRIGPWADRNARLANTLGQALPQLRNMHMLEDRVVDGFEHEAAKRLAFSHNPRVNRRVAEALRVWRPPSSSPPRPEQPPRAVKSGRSISNSGEFVTVVESVIVSLGHVETGLRQIQADGALIISRSAKQSPQDRWGWWWPFTNNFQCPFPAIIDIQWDMQQPEKELESHLRILKERESKI